MSSDSDPSTVVDPQVRFPRHFGILWLGQLLSAFGTQLNSLALVWIAVETGGENAGFVVAAGATGRLLFSLIGGAYADRVDRQKMMVRCDVLCAIAVATLPFADFTSPGAVPSPRRPKTPKQDSA